MVDGSDGKGERLRGVYRAKGSLYKSIGDMSQAIGFAIDDLHGVMEWLREEGQYDKSDRIRTIIGNLARAQLRNSADPDAIREIARKYK